MWKLKSNNLNRFLNHGGILGSLYKGNFFESLESRLLIGFKFFLNNHVIYRKRNKLIIHREKLNHKANKIAKDTQQTLGAISIVG